MVEQKKQFGWEWQWNKIDTFEENKWLFKDWILPNKIEDFRNKIVLDAGCGNGRHLSFIAPYINLGVGVDLNSSNVAKALVKYDNLSFFDRDIASMNLKRKFDIVYCIGVIHHTDNPTVTFRNLLDHTDVGGRVIIWVYSYEGNFINRTILEGLKRHFFLKLNKKTLWILSHIITLITLIPVNTIYRLPIKSLPFYDYFTNWRKMSFKRVNHTVFDKLNAPTTHFIKKETIKEWFNKEEFTDVHISSYKKVSWRASGNYNR